MSFSGTIRQMLISSPGDVPKDDLSLIHKAINRWNVMYGPRFGSVVVPVSWSEHAAAEFGRPPQDMLNDQIVDGSDMCLAIFANRLGTPTDSAESGTAEEIERLANAGRYVGILRCKRQVDASRLDADQMKGLNAYLSKIRDRALVLDYSSDSELERHVESVIVAAVSRDLGRSEIEREQGVEVQANVSSGQDSAEVWPRMDVKEEVRTDSKGRLKTRRNRRLVLTNTGVVPALNVRFETEAVSGSAGENWIIHRDRTDDDDSASDVESLAPHGGEIGFPVLAVMGSASQVRCRVTWEDPRGTHENIANLALS